MDLKAKKLHVIEEILAVTNEGLIDKLEAFLKKEQHKEESQRVSIEQYNKELEEANIRIESGEYTSHDDVKRESDKWLR